MACLNWIWISHLHSEQEMESTDQRLSQRSNQSAQTSAQICVLDCPQFEGGLNKGLLGQNARSFNPLQAYNLLYNFGPTFSFLTPCSVQLDNWVRSMAALKTRCFIYAIFSCKIREHTASLKQSIKCSEGE